MKKLTQKATIEICRELRVDVLSFHPTSLVRNSSYGGLHPLQALAEVAKWTKRGYPVLILPRIPYSANDYFARKNADVDADMWEAKHGKRIPFDVAQKMALDWKDIIGEYRQ